MLCNNNTILAPTFFRSEVVVEEERVNVVLVLCSLVTATAIVKTTPLSQFGWSKESFKTFF